MRTELSGVDQVFDGSLHETKMIRSDLKLDLIRDILNKK